jgi:glycosyltransferase
LDKELIIVDGLSSDGTEKIVEKYKDKISYYIREEDTNLYDAMNKGIRFASGDIIHLLNHDDYYYDKDVLLKVSIFFQENNPDIIHGPMLKVDGNKNIVANVDKM